MSSAKKKSASKSKGSDPTVVVARELAAIAQEHGVAELEYRTSDLKLIIRREVAPVAGAPAAVAQMMPAMASHPVSAPVMAVAQAPATAPIEAAPEKEKGHEVTSPFVGTFYRSPNPEAASYVEIGQRIEKGQVLCIVEAMKLMNEIEADVAGTIAGILVQNAEPVEYGQPLFRIDPA